jgi:hypothetical protein
VVIDNLDVVVVGIEHERGVVARVVGRALARLAVAAIPGGDGDGVEPAHRLLVATERQVKVRRRLSGPDREAAARRDRERRTVLAATPDGEPHCITDRRVERGAGGRVGNTNRDMVDRAGRPGAGPVNGFEVVAGIVEEDAA